MTEEPTPHILVHEGGPYEVTGEPILTKREPSRSVYGEPLAWEAIGVEGADYERRERTLLCRCGQSNAKPYCDGSHKKVDFQGKLTADRAPRASREKLTKSDGISMTDDGSLCEHAGFCGTRFTNVWAMMESTKDPEVRETARRMIANCPSGRLGYGPGFEELEPQFEPSVAMIKDGPLWVRGGIKMETDDGFVYEKLNRMTLCRCGQSSNKPFCDGTHKEVGFKAD